MHLISVIGPVLTFLTFTQVYRFMISVSRNARTSLLVSIPVTPIVLLLGCGLVQLTWRLFGFLLNQFVFNGHCVYVATISICLILLNFVLTKCLQNRQPLTVEDCGSIVQKIVMYYLFIRIASLIIII